MKLRCQSCGMPIEQDPQKGGTNADGSKTTEYCSYCFVDGQFKDDFTTAKEMQVFVKGKLREHGMGVLMAWFLSLDIPRLRRWKAAK